MPGSSQQDTINFTIHIRLFIPIHCPVIPVFFRSLQLA